MTTYTAPMTMQDGVDVFVHDPVRTADELAELIRDISDFGLLQLTAITSGGVEFWPDGRSDATSADHWRCRFLAPEPGTSDNSHVHGLLGVLSAAGIDWVKIEGLPQR